MRTRSSICLLVLVFFTTGSIQRGVDEAPVAQDYLGTWSGSWEGAGASGGFEITLEKGEAGLAGSVSVTDPTYKATFKTVAFDGPKMTAKYDFPPDESLEVTLVATFEQKNAKGTWSVIEKSSGAESASGTWTVAKK
jgi:hypothetical protein